jgi:hypothetical protein
MSKYSDDPEDEDDVPFDDYVFDETEDYRNEVGLTNALDHEILMHRDSHFGGLFSVMIEYYEREGKGVDPNFTLERIQTLADEEDALGQNLAALILSGTEAERVARAKIAYKQLRDFYEIPEAESYHARLLADLILSEDELPEKEIENIVGAGHSVVQALVDLMKSEDFLDPLYPGYGLAPHLAAICLGRIGDERGIIPLFELIGKEDFFLEEDLLSALKNIGEPSKSFLLHIIQSRPLTEDNERAALALTSFSEDPEVSMTAFHQLEDPAVIKKHNLAAYLILCCEGLEKPYRAAFQEIARKPALSEDLQEEIRVIANNWSP